MKTKRKMPSRWRISACLLILTMLISIVFAGINLTKSSAETLPLESEKIASTYFVGETFSVPDSVEITVNGETVTATDAVIRFPDGTIKTKGTYTLKDLGEYSVVYSFTHNGQKYKAEKSFKVSKYKAEFNNDALNATYGDLMMSATEDKKEKGLTISLSEGDEFIFKAPFNVNDVEDGWANICRIYPVPVEDNADIPPCLNESHKGLEDPRVCKSSINCVKFVIVKVIDCYDPNNYVEVLINNNLMTKYAAGRDYCDGLYSMARSSTQDWVGLRQTTTASNTTVSYNGKYYVRDTTTLDFVHTRYGSPTWGKTNLKVFAEQGGFNFSYNEETKQLKFNSSNRPETDNHTMINDLDSSAIYGKNLFKGFTTGEVYVSIYCADYRKDAPQQIEIASLLGVEGEDLNNYVTEDTTAPLIRTKIGLDDGDTLYVSQNEMFTAPEFVAYDLNLKSSNVGCYMNYGTDNESVVYMKDGKFTPTRNGKYTLVYSATDKYGNRSEFMLNLYCVDKKGLTFDQINVQDVVVENAVCKLPVVSVQGLNGAVETTINVTDPKGNKFVAEDYEFDIKYLGDYHLEYVFTDGIYSASTTATYTNNSQEAFFLDKLILNKHYLKSIEYSIADYFAYTCSDDGLKANKCEVFVSSDGGEFVAISENDCLAYTVTAKETLQFKYKFGEKEFLSDVVDVIDAIDSTDSTVMDYTKCFVTPFSITENPQNYTFSAQADGKIEFINPISVPDFLLEFEFDAEKLNFSILNIYLEDYYSHQSVKFSFKKNESKKLLFALNDGDYTGAGIDFCTAYKIFYQDGKILTNLGDSVAFDLSGFDAEIAHLTFEIVNVNGDSSFILTKIGNQAFRETIKEAGSTFIVPEKSRLLNLGDKYVIDVPKVSNVLFPVLTNNVTVTVIDDKGEIVKDVDGNLLNNFPITTERTIEVTMPGIYVVKYTVVVNTLTKSISTASKPIALNVADNIAPEVSFNDGIDENSVINAKVNEAHTILPYTVSDNALDRDLTVRIAIYNDRNALVDYGEFAEYVFKKAGTYTVKVVCFDEDGNQARASYTVVVE